MDDVETLAHTTWESKYHVVFIPKYRRKTLYGQLRKDLGGVFRRLAEQKACPVEEGHLMADHVHMLVSIHGRACRRAACIRRSSLCGLLSQEPRSAGRGGRMRVRHVS